MVDDEKAKIDVSLNTLLGKMGSQEFGPRLYEAMTAKGMSQSDLARKVWGVKKDPRGYDVAKNRDRVSHYLKGASVPDSKNLKAIADALGLTPEELLPSRGLSRRRPDVSLNILAGAGDQAHLLVDRVVGTRTALKILNLIESEKDAPEDVE